MKVFVTGHRGYIGVHLVDQLKAAGHTVVGADVDLFEGCAWEPITDPDVDLKKDTRQITERGPRRLRRRVPPRRDLE